MGTEVREATPAAELPYDAFLSYSAKDQRLVVRVQRFLEGFRFGTPKRRVRVFLDRTDIRGGELHSEIRAALERARTLVVCWSAAAADSLWVEREIELFRELHGERNIAILLLGDQSTPPPPRSRGPEWRFHDCRSGWLFGVLRPHGRLELLRLLAFLTEVDLRTLRNWHLRRTARNAVGIALAAIVPPLAVLTLPVEGWAKLDLRIDRKDPLYAIAAEVRDEKLWVASRFRGNGPQGFRNYIRTVSDAFDPHARAQFGAPLRVGHRLLPVHLLDRAIAARLPSVDVVATTRRTSIGRPFVGEPRPGHFVVVQPVTLTPEEEEQARETSLDLGVPVFPSNASVVVVADGRERRSVEVAGMVPEWADRTPASDPTSPARGIAVVWADNGEIWLGVAGQDARLSGGLWHSPDAGRSWQKVEPFLSVNSISIRSVEGRPVELLVTESYFEHWNKGLLEPYPASVSRRTLPDGPWVAALMPPFGTRSEVELCGTLGGTPIVRVDTTLFRHQSRPLWRTVLSR